MTKSDKNIGLRKAAADYNDMYWPYEFIKDNAKNAPKEQTLNTFARRISDENKVLERSYLFMMSSMQWRSFRINKICRFRTSLLFPMVIAEVNLKMGALVEIFEAEFALSILGVL